MRTIEELTNEELMEKYLDGLEEYKRWENSSDGSSGACWDNQVAPYLKEIERRGLENEIALLEN